jgi:hypothetical protein
VWQLYSHWAGQHSDNEAAQTLAKRWRAAIKNKKITEAQLDAIGPLDFGEIGSPQGREPQREAPAAAPFAFPRNFEIGSQEHADWLLAAGEI